MHDDELALAIKKIRENKPEDSAEMHRWIQVIGVAGVKELSAALEKYLYFPQNPQAAVDALKVLVLWGFDKEHRTEIKAFLEGVSWDTDEHLMQREVTWPAGLYLRVTDDKEMLQLLVDLVEDPGRIKSQKDMQACKAFWPQLQFNAYLALADAMGVSSNEIKEFSLVGHHESHGLADKDPLNVLVSAHKDLLLANGTINTDKYLKKLHAGELTQEEFHHLKECLLTTGFEKISDPHACVILFQRIGSELAQEFVPFLKKYLYSPADLEVAKEILKLFVRYLDLGKEYIDTIKQFIKGVEWDDGTLQKQSITLAGEYLREHEDAELLRLLIQMYENPDSLENKNAPISAYNWCWLQALSFGAIHEAMGVSSDDIDSFEVETLLRSEQLESLMTLPLEQAYERVGIQPSPPTIRKSLELDDIREELMAKAERGKLSEEETLFAAKKLNGIELHELVHMDEWIHIVGKSQAKVFRADIEKYLVRREDSDVSVLAPQEALRALCLEWGFSQDYLPRIKECIRTDRDRCQRIAIECAGEFLRENEDTELLLELLAVYENPQEFDVDKEKAFGGYFSWNYLEYEAYLALAKAVKMSKSILAFRDYMATSRKDPVIKEIIDRAKARLATRN